MKRIRNPEQRKAAMDRYHERHKHEPDYKLKKYRRSERWRKAHPERYATLKYRYGNLKRKAKYRKQDMTLSLDDYAILTEGQPCNYCGRSLEGIAGILLDRMDSAIGYVHGNCVACCPRCNTMKLDLTMEEFYRHISIILANRRRSRKVSPDQSSLF